jgi:NADH-quinone oxidoreductase subunit H
MSLLAAETITFSFNWVTTLILIVVVFTVVMGACAYQILLERKIAAWTQDRIGPNRAGPLGLLQPIADGLKFFFKEEVIPSHVDRLFFLLAPCIAVITALLAIAVVPVGPTTPPPGLPGQKWLQTVADEKAFQAKEAERAAAGEETFQQEVEKYNNTLQFVIAPRVDIGIVFVFAIGSLAVYAIVLGGWSSNSKYSLIGALRSSAQLISYEIPMGLSVLGVLLVTGSLNLEKIIDFQHAHGWNILFQPTACLLFCIAIFAECNRLPFDLPESEQELVGGYHTEYGAMKFALFFLGEYAHMVTVSFLMVSLFFGGWLLPGLATPETGGVILKLIIFVVKATLFIVFFMVVRWTLPRFRFDQLMGLAWKGLLPLGVANLVGVLVIKHFEPELGRHGPWLMLPLSLAILIAAGYLTLRLPPTHGRTPLNVSGPGTPRPLATRP